MYGHYYLDLESLLMIMANAKLSGMLSSSFSGGVLGIKEDVQAILTVREGTVVSCQLKTMRGLVDARKSLSQLRQIGEREWALMPIALPSQSPQDSVQSTIPRLARRIDQYELMKLQRIQRHVLQLINGQRSFQDIANILMQDVSIIKEIISDLVGRGLVILQDRE